MWMLVGSYSKEGNPGGITVFNAAGQQVTKVGAGDRQIEAGYLTHGAGKVYSVDERKGDGRGPVGPVVGIHAFDFDVATGELTWEHMAPAFGAFPTYLDFEQRQGLLTCASHGSFEHVQQIVKRDGQWAVEFQYDDSTVTVYDAALNLQDVVVLSGHGMDPNSSPQAGGHAQSSAHAHCATVDPSGHYVIVCDKGTDRILTYRLSKKLELVSSYAFAPETAPRHVAFNAKGDRLFVNLELASSVASMEFDQQTGALKLIDQVETVSQPARVNEPAEIRIHPNGNTLYVNNRGEDAIVWFSISDQGKLSRQGALPLAASIHPGLAARSFMLSPDGHWLYLADRPADLVRVYQVGQHGELQEVGSVPVSQPAYVLLIDQQES